MILYNVSFPGKFCTKGSSTNIALKWFFPCYFGNIVMCLIFLLLAIKSGIFKAKNLPKFNDSFLLGLFQDAAKAYLISRDII